MQLAGGILTNLAIKYNEEWKIVRPDKWKKLLMPYSHQHDAESNNLVSVLPKDVFETLTRELSLHACSLQITSDENAFPIVLTPAATGNT